MKILSLEIRKADNNMTELFSRVDNVLAKHGVAKYQPIPKQTKALALINAVKKMSNEDSFDVCVIRTLIDLTGVHIRSDRMAFYRLHHCMDWADMGPETTELLQAMLLDDFGDLLLPNETMRVVDHLENL